MNKELNDIINRSLDNKKEIRLLTKIAGAKYYDGVVLHTSEDFICLKQMKDFEFDGIVFVSRSVIITYRDSGMEKCANEVLQLNNQVKKIKRIKWVEQISNYKQLFTLLKTREIWPAVDIFEKKKNALYVGPITRVEENTFGIYCYDATGKWEAEYKLMYSKIVAIEINTKYLNNFNLYMKNK